MTISARDYILLKGLKDSGHAWVAASEAEDALRLAEQEFVTIWQTGTGFSAWRLTDGGKARIEMAIASHEAIV